MTPRCGSSGGHGGDSPPIPSAAYGEIMLFGVRVKVDPLRKSVSLNDLSQYEQPCYGNNDPAKSAAAAAEEEGYGSADDVAPNLSSSGGGRERKRGVPWTEEEHKLFLLGLQKVGKGDWRGISRHFVKSRTPTQVASHAQKYFLRRSNLNRRRRRSSLFDITTDSVSLYSMEEGKASNESLAPQVVTPTSVLSIGEPTLQINGFQQAPLSPPPSPPITETLDPTSLSLTLSLSGGHPHGFTSVFNNNNGGGGISVL